MASEDEVSLLVIVVDVNPIWWGQHAQREPEFTLSKCLDAVMVMGNSHLAMSRTNKLAVIASHCQDSHFLYPSKSWKGADSGADDASSSGDGKYELLSVANNLIAEEMRNVMSKTEVRGNSTDTLLAGSLAKALCYIHRVSKELEVGQEIKSRILVIKAAEDCALQYMNFMNVIFAAQKQNILIDACVLDSDSGLLQQACDITGGLYLKIPQKIALAQYLLSSVHSWCCRRLHTWTTELHVSVIATSSRLVTCAQFVCQYSATLAPSVQRARLSSKYNYHTWSSPKRRNSSSWHDSCSA
ncbi:putative general transcription factor IIH subunit 3 [Scophthalmus maximus]|uniref:General transcription factor IIH subunit 3 n=1 Tax=Scophthalmus maximus TaxID=52904 RepID=A0A2U9BUK2_SCOMX|nr:general transcription factor IIH subunit 3 isoform X2 [Scophthalmus maximus]AWP07176.1 putative general transcription factor IIH subunit 3 [Scophthalmus maximus]